MDRFGATTEHLRDTACRLLVHHGVRAFTQEALAEAACVSIGTIYQRWSSKSETLEDVAASRLMRSLEGMHGELASLPQEDRCTHVFDSPEGRHLLVFAAETLLAARHQDELHKPATDVVNSLSRLLAHPTTNSAAASNASSGPSLRSRPTFQADNGRKEDIERGSKRRSSHQPPIQLY